VVVHTCGRPLVVIAGGRLYCCIRGAGPPAESSVHGVTIACSCFVCFCSYVHRPREIVVLSGGVILDGVGAVIRGVLDDIG